MTSTSFNIKPPERHFSARPTNLNRQQKLIPPKNNSDFIGQYSINFTIKQNNKFQSIFNSLSSKTLTKTSNSQRKNFKPLSVFEISSIKLQFQKEGQKRKERSLKNILFSHRNQQTQNKQKRTVSNKFRPNTTHRSSKSPSHKLENQEALNLSKQLKAEKDDQKILLESTNFTVRSYSWLNRNQLDTKQKTQISQRKNSMHHSSSLKTSKKSQNSQSNLLNNQKSQQQTNIKPTEQAEIQIRLSLKSMSRSEEGNEKQCPERTTMEKWIIEENKRLQETNESNLRTKRGNGPAEANTQNEKRQVLTGTTYKQNRMILKFDKRLLKNKSQLNDPCLIVSRISKISSRVKTETNHL